MTRDEKLIEITNHFGIQSQMAKTLEELGELIAELARDVNRGDECLTDGTLQEMEDVSVMLAQLLLSKDYKIEIDKKIDRTLERIKNGYYD